MSRAFAEAHQRKHGFLCNGTEAISPVDLPESRKSKLRKAKEPNATEAEYGLILEAMKRKGEIVHYVFEGISLRWADGLRYTADYAVFAENARTRLIEIKGRQNKAIRRRDDAIVRFKGCRAEWKTYFDFEMWEKGKDGWQRID